MDRHSQLIGLLGIVLLAVLFLWAAGGGAERGDKVGLPSSILAKDETTTADNELGLVVGSAELPPAPTADNVVESPASAATSIVSFDVPTIT